MKFFRNMDEMELHLSLNAIRVGDEIDMGIDVDGFLHEVHVERIPETFHGMAVRVFR